MSQVHDALAAAIRGASRPASEPEPVFEEADVEEIADVFEDEGRGSTRAMARAVLGPGADERRIRSTMRSIQRWRKAARGEAGQTRQPSPASVPALRKLRTTARRRWRSRRGAISGASLARRRGVDMQLSGWLRVSRTWSFHTMPRGEPQPIGPELMGPVMDVYDAGGDTGDVLLAAFFAAYWRASTEPAEIGEMDDVMVRVR